MADSDFSSEARGSSPAARRARGGVPESTYRLQFHAGFTFRDAAQIVPYLAELGITHVYASPYLKARVGSTHGYDVVDHCQLNPELGGEEGFVHFIQTLEEQGMGHILDVVPNHAGVATNENAWWNDVLEKGPASKYARHFDIAWRDSGRPELRDKVLLPILGDPYGAVLESGQIRLEFDAAAGRFLISCYERRLLPVRRETYDMILGGRGGELHGGLTRDGELDRFIRERLASFNGTPGDARSFDRLHELLERQHYRLAYWRTASDEINYRRFFDINDLAALSQERQEVFEETHRLILDLLAEGKLHGLRIDHPDGLYDPREYLERLQGHHRAPVESEGAAEEPARPVYVVVEKILAVDEKLPDEWACNGTSGYDFLNRVNGLFIDGDGEAGLTTVYEQWVGRNVSFEEQAYRSKRLTLEASLASELSMLAHLLDRLAQRHPRWRDFTLRGLTNALREVVACFPVYRTYITKGPVSSTDAAHVETAVREATARNPGADPRTFDLIRDVVLRRLPPEASAQDVADSIRFAGKFQQLTAPVMAKGVEDTAFYRYHRLVSLNEVGGEPAHFGFRPEEVHGYLAERQQAWPHALSALSTHDTKRSEDVRARLNLLSEVPEAWREQVNEWGRLNAAHRCRMPGGLAPDRNDEYLLYQALLGAWPLDASGGPGAEFVARIQAYMLKATREAKVHTSWTAPNEPYESAVKDFVGRVLDPVQSPALLRAFTAFQERISRLGLLNGLAQTLLKLTAPGVPDTYQGTELWDFSLVDPDNRRPVDYGRRREMLDALKAQWSEAGGRLSLAREVSERLEDGRAKLLVTWQSLELRRRHPGLFSVGAYLPLEVRGPAADHVFAFARQWKEEAAIVVAPRLVWRLAGESGTVPIPREAWEGTRLCFQAEWYGAFRSVFTGEEVGLQQAGNGPALEVGEVLGDFPVGLLLRR